MRVVIDTCSLQGEELEAFLAMSPHHTALLTDYAAVESFSGDTLLNISTNMAVVAKFPHQAMVLCTTGRAVELDAAKAGMAAAMIDKKQTRSLPTFLEHVCRSFHGPVLARQLRERGEHADHRLSRMLGTVEEIKDAITQAKSAFSQSDLALIRKRENWSPSIKLTILTLASELAQVHIGRLIPSLIPPRSPNLWNHFLYRYALCYVLHLIMLIRDGAEQRKPEKDRNDKIDVI